MELPSISISGKGKSGFTLIEILIVMSLLIAVGFVLAFADFDIWRGYNFRGECDLVISILQKARSQSINNICLGTSCTDGKPHGVYIQSNKYTIFQGNDWNNRDDVFDEDYEASSNINSAGSTITEVVFSQLSGDVSVEGEIVLNEINGFRSRTIYINNEGRISW